MKKEPQVIRETRYISEAYRDIESTDPRDAEVIEWLDNNPVVYEIVTKNKSKAFGIKSCAYIGWAQKNNSTDAILERIRHFKSRIEPNDNIFDWSAKFTLAHYKDKGFKGGFFQQHDKEYPRGCMSLDYTPETLEEVVKNFVGWLGSMYETHRITIDNKDIPPEVWKKFL